MKITVAIRLKSGEILREIVQVAGGIHVEAGLYERAIAQAQKAGRLDYFPPHSACTIEQIDMG